MRLSAEVERLASELESVTSLLVEVDDIWLVPGKVQSIWTEAGQTLIDGVPCNLSKQEAAQRVNELRSRSMS